NTNTGTTTVSAGNLVLAKSSGNAIGGNLTLSAGTTTTLNGNDQIADLSALSVSASTLNLNGHSDTVGSISTLSGGSITGGSLTLSGAANTTTATGTSAISSNVQ